MRKARGIRHANALLLAMAVLATTLGLAPAGTAGAWDPTPPGIPAGSVKIPLEVQFITKTVQTGVDAQGRAAGYCFDEAYVTFDKMYGRPGNDGSHSWYAVGTNADGSPWSAIRYDSDNVFAVNYPQGAVFPNPWFTVDHHFQIVYRAAWGGSASTHGSGLLVDTGEGVESRCAPSVRGPRVAAMKASVENWEFWTSMPLEPPVDLSIVAPDGPFEIGEDIPVTWKVTNDADHPATGISFQPTSGMAWSNNAVEIVSSSGPALPSTLGPGESVTRQYVVRPKAQATSQLTGKVTATVDGATFTDSGAATIAVPPDLEVVLSTDVSGETRVGDEFHVTATLTNHDTVDLLQIDSEPLSSAPSGPVKWVSGPLTANGDDPEDELVDLAPGETTTLHWTYLAEDPGVVELTSYIEGVDTTLWTTFNVSASTTVAIETTELVLDQVRLQPGHIVPGQFGNIRGTVTNTGSVDVKDIDFTLQSTPELVIVEGRIAQQGSAVSPRIQTLAPDETREFMIPVAMVIDAGNLASYRADLRMAGTARIDDEFVEVAGTATTGDGLDLSPYWSTIIGEVKRNLLSDTIDFFEGVNDWGESSTLAGVAVGSTEGALKAFQKMGDGVLATGDFVIEEVGSGGARLTETGKAAVAATREYLHTHTAKEMGADLAALGYNVNNTVVGTLGHWMRDVDRAASAGNAREVSRLLAEPATELLVGVGVEKAAGQLFARAVQSAVARKAVSYLKRSPEPLDESIWLPTPEMPEIPFDRMVARELQDLKDMPTGVPLTGETAARVGLTADEHAWMIEMAKEHGVTFFVRPRPEIAAKFAALGYNAKPMAIKLKSISEIDAKWLGWDDFTDSQGLVVFRKPKDPLQAMMDAVEAGELEPGSFEIDEIIARYNHRLAEWKSFEKPFGDNGPTVDPQQGILHKLNGDTLNPDGSITPGEGFDIQRYGNTKRTKVTIDSDGVIKFTHNNQPVYSDIDLLAIAKPDGTHISADLHKLISKAAGFGIDSQHGDSVLTSDFPNWNTAKKFATQYAQEHMRGGDPLLIVQPDATTLGYVDQLTVPDGDIPGSDYDLYGLMSTTYEGAGRR
jgi:hypothetical protein